MKQLPLNDAQRQAVECRTGPLLILAGAGSGKTRVLTCRLAHLISEHGVRPDRIMAVTFTNRSAGEMRRRVAELLGTEPAGLWIGTFHSLSARLLRREAHLLGFTPRFSIYDEDDRQALIKRLLVRGGKSAKTFRPAVIRAIISHAKNRLVPPEELAAEATDEVTSVAAEIYHEMSRVLVSANAMDFDDLLIHPLTVFREHPDRLQLYQRRFQSILVDEFQDTNRAQYLFVRNLSAHYRDICVVGDDDQSIYGWRGAEIKNMLDFCQDFPTATTIRLEENYRSSQMILDVANSVIAVNQNRLGKTLYTSRSGGDRVTLVAAADERDEAEWVARELRERATTDHYPLSDMAVLYRTNAQSRAFEDAFRRMVIPHRVVGAVSFYARREVRDLIAYLRLLVNPADDEAFVRAVQVPKRGIGLSSLNTLQETAVKRGRSLLETSAIVDRIPELRPQARSALQAFARSLNGLRSESDHASPAAVLERVIEVVDYEGYLHADGPEGIERMENVRELIAGAAEWSEESDPEEPTTPLERFLASAALTTATEQTQGDPSGVNLMTLHTAKGLEWPVVVMAGMEDGLLPLARSLETVEGAEEERRLAYVGVTRAADRLYLTWARSRRRGGQLVPSRPSRFLDALPPGVIDERRTSGVFGGDLYRRPKNFPWRGFSVAQPEMESQLTPRYVKGERVRHSQFGSGTIRELGGYGRDLKVHVEFDDPEIGTKQLLVAYAGLERDWEEA